jgi:hypothetical protein
MLKRPEIQNLARFDFVKPGALSELGVPSAVSSTRPRVRAAAVNRNIQILQYEKDCARVILVPVGQDQGPQLVTVFPQEGDIGDDDLDSQLQALLSPGEGDARVDENHVRAVSKGGAVHAELAHDLPTGSLRGKTTHGTQDSTRVRCRNCSSGISSDLAPGWDSGRLHGLGEASLVGYDRDQIIPERFSAVTEGRRGSDA